MITRTFTAALTLFLLMAVLTGPADATLLDIGTAIYGGNNYNLLYDANSPFGSIVWLNYSNAPGTWSNQMNWASNLSGALTCNLIPGYSMNWSGDWRLPITDSVSPANANGLFGWNITSSEMGYLFYTDLGNTTSGLTSKGLFTNLESGWYWSGTECITGRYAWFFGPPDGEQNYDDEPCNFLALAVHPGQLETASVPEPSTFFLLGAGLAGVGFLRRKIRT